MNSTDIRNVLDSRGIAYCEADLDLLVRVTSPKTTKRGNVFPAQYSNLDEAIADLLDPKAIRAWLNARTV